jgi:gamma-glutamylcyclotransferase (GGCT)/AIG2-like uncharacterized protein YtfP
MRLFLYGTLKRGARNHHYLGGGTFLGVATTMPAYRLYDLGPYPALVEEPGTGIAVSGELWEVLAALVMELDSFEGVPTLFERRSITLAHDAGPAHAYFYMREVPPGAPSGSAWPLRTGG